MIDNAYLEITRLRLRAVLAIRDRYGLTDAVADRINDLECLIAHETRRQERLADRRAWLWFGRLGVA